MLTDAVISFIRTFVPMLVGAAVTWLLKLGIEIDAAALDAVLYAAISGGYYALVRWLEYRWPSLGWLIGYGKATPKYV